MLIKFEAIALLFLDPQDVMKITSEWASGCENFAGKAGYECGARTRTPGAERFGDTV